MPVLKRGSQGDELYRFYDYFQKWAKSYASLMGNRDGYFGLDEENFVKELQSRLLKGGHRVAVNGIFGDLEAKLTGYRFLAGNNPVAEYRPIHFYSAPGSGADWNVGPSYAVGEYAKNVLKINHQPVGFAKGGYLGLMGGDPGLSYIDVITSLYHELDRLLSINPDVISALEARKSNPINPVNVELWFSGYSQSADGMAEAVLKLFGDGGKYAVLRDRINGLLLFGNPATPVTGIARKNFPVWLSKLITNINTTNDFYAVARDRVRPLFYEWFIRAETELPFVVYSAQIILPALANAIPILGPVMGPLFPLALAMQAGMNNIIPLVTALTGGLAKTNEKPNPKLIELLSIQGILTNIPDLLSLVIALPGLQSHGEYHLPKPEFKNLSGIQVATKTMDDYRR